MTPTDNIKEVCTKIYQGTQSDMARALGLSPQVFGQYYNGKLGPGNKFLKRCEEAGINKYFIMDGKGSIFADNEAGNKLRADSIKKTNISSQKTTL